MISPNYDTIRMSIDERHRAAEHRTMVRQAKCEARALRPKSPSPLHVLGGASGALMGLAPWKALRGRAAHRHALTGA